MATTADPVTAPVARPATAESWLARWWPLLLVTVFAAALRLSTLNLQSFWYDEAYTPVHVLHGSLWATLRGVGRTENTPPLWYILAWLDSRVLGTGEVALRLPSALVGIATVPVVWAIGRELSGKRVAIACAVLVAVNPLFVWYSQEARAYGLFVFTAALATLCFLRAYEQPMRRRMWAFALAGALALLSHYFALFLLIPMVLWLLSEQRTRVAAVPAVAVLVVVGAALIPLIAAQGGQNTQWIGEWALSLRLQAIPQYYLTGYSGMPLGHSIELLVALPILVGLAFGCAQMRKPAVRERRGLLLMLSIALCGVLIPLAMVGAGDDVLAPRNLVGAMIPVAIVVALVTVWPGTGRVGMMLAAAIALASLAISIDVDLSPRLQRSNWRDFAKLIPAGPSARVITTFELGTAPLQYYLPHMGLHELHAGSSVVLSEIDESGFEPFRTDIAAPPAPGFKLISRQEVDGLLLLRFVSPTPRTVSEATLRQHVITLGQAPGVLVPKGAQVLPAA